MATLHIIRASAYENAAFSQALLYRTKQDVFVFIDDGVLCLTHQEIHQLQNHSCYVLNEHLMARALTNKLNFIKEIDFQEFVELTCTFKPCVTWQ